MGKHPCMLSKFPNQMSDRGTKWVMYKLGCPFSLKDKKWKKSAHEESFFVLMDTPLLLHVYYEHCFGLFSERIFNNLNCFMKESFRRVGNIYQTILIFDFMYVLKYFSSHLQVQIVIIYHQIIDIEMSVKIKSNRSGGLNKPYDLYQICPQ